MRNDNLFLPPTDGLCVWWYLSPRQACRGELQYGCTREGLYYENQGDSFSIKLPDRDLDVLDTNVSIRSL
jgi:hypothetical protein